MQHQLRFKEVKIVFDLKYIQVEFKEVKIVFDLKYIQVECI